jgi:hypothetical protein
LVFDELVYGIDCGVLMPAMADDRVPPPTPANDTPEPHDAVRAAGRGLLWIAIGVAIVVVLLVVFMLGPLGLVIVVPAVLLIWFIAGASSGTPAAGA